MIRSHASFQGDFPKERTENEPAGREIADLLSSQLPGKGLLVHRRDSTEYSHTLHIRAGKSRFYAEIGLVDDGDREWLVFVEPAVRWLFRIVGVSSTHRRALEAVHEILANDSRISQLRWYTEREWNNNPFNGVPTPV
jgi:hypothetical protein